jgi:hypothetical protein
MHLHYCTLLNCLTAELKNRCKGKLIANIKRRYVLVAVKGKDHNALGSTSSSSIPVLISLFSFMFVWIA